MQGDSLWIKNIAFSDTIVVINNPRLFYIIQMKKQTYPVKEVKIFEWGSTYEDFKQAFLALKPEKGLQEKLGLPIADPDAIPYDLDEEYIKSLGFAITSPISYFYQNFSKYEKSKRKLYRLEITKEKREVFRRIVSRENISELTGWKIPNLNISGFTCLKI